nr:helix-hairpin-helix domain-containing protein [Actinomadura sp. WMMA1423]
MRAAEAAAGALDVRDAPEPAQAPPPEPGRTPEEGLRALEALLAETGAPAALAARTAARLGPSAAGRLREDPWRLLSVPGVRPEQADHFARALLGDGARPDDPRRGGALVLHLLTEAARQGHTVTPAADVLSALERLRYPDPPRAVEAALDEAEVLSLTEEPEFDEEAFEEDAEPAEPEETLGPARWALAEEAAAEGFQRLTLTAAPLGRHGAEGAARRGSPRTAPSPSPPRCAPASASCAARPTGSRARSPRSPPPPRPRASARRWRRPPTAPRPTSPPVSARASR